MAEVDNIDFSDGLGEIYCDMDGVLVDFETGALRLLTSILDGTAEPKWKTGSSSMPKNIEKLRKIKGEDWRPETKADIDEMRQIMLSAISLAPGDFFLDLPEFEDGTGELWSYLNDLGRPVHILSAPIKGREGSGMTAGDGKRLWVENHLSPPPASVIIADAKDKHKWAVDGRGRPNLLVDDKEKTIVQWTASGGIGILHTPGDSSSSIEKIKRALGY